MRAPLISIAELCEELDRARRMQRYARKRELEASRTIDALRERLAEAKKPPAPCAQCKAISKENEKLSAAIARLIDMNRILSARMADLKKERP